MNHTDCLTTTFKNISGGVLRTSFIAPHGYEFPINGEVSMLGSPTEIATFGRSPSHCARALAGLAAALMADLIIIKKTPNPIFYDVTSNLVKMVKMTGGKLYGADACWANTAGSSITVQT